MMTERDRERQERSHRDQHSGLETDHNILERRLSQFLHEQAEQIHSTPTLRENILRQLPSHRSSHSKLFFVVALASAAMLILAGALAVYAPYNQHPPQLAVHYVISNTIDVAPELANGGHLISLDPTEQHFVYQSADTAGVMYTTDLIDPVDSNFLAMRDALAASWSPDGATLVATVAPAGASLPILALVPHGKYMYPLGHDALAASWFPLSPQQITYVIQSHGQTQLWNTTPDGQVNRLQATIPIPLIAKHLLWSQDGKKLALAVANTATTDIGTLNLPARTIYMMDSHTQQVQQIVSSGAFTIGTLIWSPDSHYLAYEQIDAQGKQTLHVVDSNQQKHNFIITPRHTLQGWAWSPDSHTLIYSDGGVLQAHVLQGANIIFPSTTAQQISPFWLKDGRILYLQITEGTGKLVFLQNTSK